MLKLNNCKKFKKKCSCCNQLKLTNQFRKQKDCKDGFRNKCKECCKTHIYTCQYCGKTFKGDSKKPKYCSRECMGKANIKVGSKVKIKCEICGKEKEIKKQYYENAEHHFCSLKCRSKYRSLYESGINSKSFKRIKINCEICGKEVFIPERQYKSQKHHYCSKECSNKGWTINYSGENNPLYGTKRPEMTGENNPSWNPNLTDEEREYKRLEEGLKKWKENVMIRDNYTCQVTGKRGGNLNCHHLNSYHWDKEHRTDINNGITISEEIHKLFHKTYGYKNNTKEQFEEFKHRYHNGEFKEVI